MKILFVTNCYPSKERPHYCVYLEQQAQALQSLGHAVEVLFLGSEEADYIQNGIRIRVLKISNRFVEKFIVCKESRRCLKGFPWHEYHAVSMHFLRLSYKNAIARTCRKASVPVLVHYHGLNIWRECREKVTLKQRIIGFVGRIQSRCLLGRITAVVGVSDMVCSEVKRGYSSVKAYTVYNGVDLTRFYPDENKENTKEFRIICVANLIPIKGLRYLLEGVAMLKDREIKVTLIGEGYQREALEEQSRVLGVNAEFLGTRNHEEVARYMRCSDMFIMPSYFEAFGCVFVEAMGSGILTCGCLGTGAEEIIEAGVSGLLLPQRSSESVADAIRFAMENRAEAEAIARRGTARARDFSWRASAQTLEKVYKEVRYE